MSAWFTIAVVAGALVYSTVVVREYLAAERELRLELRKLRQEAREASRDGKLTGADFLRTAQLTAPHSRRVERALQRGRGMLLCWVLTSVCVFTSVYAVRYHDGYAAGWRRTCEALTRVAPDGQFYAQDPDGLLRLRAAPGHSCEELMMYSGDSYFVERYDWTRLHGWDVGYALGREEAAVPYFYPVDVLCNSARRCFSRDEVTQS